MNAELTVNTRVVAEVASEARATFIRRTYTHLAAALMAFMGLEYVLLSTPWAERMTAATLDSPYSWLVVLGAFMVVSWLADRWAQSSTSRQMQYTGLTLYVVAEAVIFVPLLYVAGHFASPVVVPAAALLTGLLVLGLTIVVLTSQTDFSFLGGILKLGGLMALGVIVASVIAGFSLGLLFSAVMIALAAASVLYTTSNVVHRYRPEQYVAASLALFAGIALMFWFMVRMVMSLTGRN